MNLKFLLLLIVSTALFAGCTDDVAFDVHIPRHMTMEELIQMSDKCGCSITVHNEGAYARGNQCRRLIEVYLYREEKTKAR